MKKQKTVWVEVTRPPSTRDIVVIFHKNGLCRDDLSPDMTCVWRVDHVTTNMEALACIAEKAAGMNSRAFLVFGGFGGKDGGRQIYENL